MAASLQMLFIIIIIIIIIITPPTNYHVLTAQQQPYKKLQKPKMLPSTWHQTPQHLQKTL